MPRSRLNLTHSSNIFHCGEDQPDHHGYAGCLSVAPPHSEASFYRSSAGAECDLLLTFPDQTTWAIEIKRSLSPSLQKGFYFAQDDIQPAASFLVYPGAEIYSIAEGVKAIGLLALLKLIAGKN